MPTDMPSVNPTQAPTSDSPSIEPSVEPTKQPTWPCCDGSDVVTGEIHICGVANECSGFITSTECEAVGVASQCVDGYEPSDPRECMGSCYWDVQNNNCAAYGKFEIFSVRDISQILVLLGDFPSKKY